MKAARAVVTGSPHRMVGRVACPWLQDTPIEHESMLERTFLLAAISLPRLRRIQHQPFQLNLQLEADLRPTTYVPDFALNFDCGSTAIVEVKHRTFVRKALPKLRAAAKVLAAQGHAFFLVTDIELRSLGEPSSIALLKRLARLPVLPAEAAAILRVAEQFPDGIPVGELAQRASVDSIAIRRLISRGRLWCESPIATDDSMVVQPLSTQEAHHAEVLIARRFGTAPW